MSKSSKIVSHALNKPKGQKWTFSILDTWNFPLSNTILECKLIWYCKKTLDSGYNPFTRMPVWNQSLHKECLNNLTVAALKFLKNSGQLHACKGQRMGRNPEENVHIPRLKVSWSELRMSCWISLPF
jgi:hypothetical protein